MSKLTNSILGFSIGDAIGVPVEFKARDTYTITDFTGFGIHNQPIGSWSDDTSMILATMDSIIDIGTVDAVHIMKNFDKWFRHSRFTPCGIVFDIGNSTRQALINYENDIPITNCGGTDISNNGNGALMRILPLAHMIYYGLIQRDTLLDVAHLTHNHPISDFACILYSQIVCNLMSNMPKNEAIDKAIDELWSDDAIDVPNQYTWIPQVKNFDRDGIKSSGYVVDTLEAVLWCIFKTDNFHDAVITAANLGYDTDTIAALVGGLAGICYGVPDEWVRKVIRHDYIKKLCDDFENSISIICHEQPRL